MAGVKAKPQGKKKKFVGWFVDSSGKQRWFTGTPSRKETLDMALLLEAKHKRIRLGITTPTAGQLNAHKPVSEAARMYLAWGKLQGGRGGRPWGETHERMRVTHVHFWIDRLHLATLGDMSGILPKAESVLQELAGRDLAGKTLNNRREALMGFCTWLVKRGFLDDNPVKNLTRFDTTPQSRRRALTLDEIDALLAAAPPERRALYELALGSGLRLKELASLRVRNFDGVRKGLVLESAWTKGRRDGFLVLGDTPLTARLAAYCAGKDSETPLFNMPTRAARELQKDAKSAGISLETSEGKIDFHALRVTFISMLDRNGVTVRQGMELARHTTPGLTFGTYARATAGGLRDIMERIGNTLLHGEMQGDSKQRQAVGAEGLDVSGIPAGGLHASDKIGAAGSHPAGADSLEAI